MRRIESSAQDGVEPAKRSFTIPFEAANPHLSNRSIALFTVDTCVLRCYKTQKDKLFAADSPNELHKAVASEAADLPGRAGLLSRREYCHATPTTPGGENEPVFTSFLFFGRQTLPLPLSLASLVVLRNASARLR